MILEWFDTDTMEEVPLSYLVALELGVDTTHGHLAVARSLLDAIAVSLAVLVIIGVVLRLGHLDKF